MSHLKRTMTLDNGTTSVVPTVDASTNAINVIDYPHHEIHGGSAYFQVYSAIKNDTEFIEVRIQTPNTTKWGHYELIIVGSLAGTVELWAATTKTHAAGNVITMVNRNFNSTNASGLTVCHTPAGAQAGVASLGPQYYGATASGGRVSVGGGANSRGEFILKQNTAYLIKNTSRADGNALSIIIDGYEHTAKG